MRPYGDAVVDGRRLQLVQAGTNLEIQEWIVRVCDQQPAPLQHPDDPPAERVEES
jgi:hypothetical protein